MNTSCDAVIVGAGLVGLSLAPPLARAGLSVAVVDRGSLAEEAFDPDTFDARVYAISPGSASFLHSVGAWQAQRGDRITAIESMHVEGDDGGSIDFSAYDLELFYGELRCL